MSIILLDDATIAKIAAGEIIENPSSIVKELVENSIDANAKHIVVEIKDSVCNYIRVTDDGDGISEEDLELAFLRHSTSKLKNALDLLNIKSLGFRGEALASISHISKVEILTKALNTSIGIRAEVENGKIIKKNHIGLPVGTTFYVRDIFYNTPVRKKYLKSENTEFNNILDIVQKIALGNPNISIKLIKNGKIVLNSSATDNFSNHIYSILGKEFATNLIEFDLENDNFKIKGFISNNKLYRSNRFHQYIYINNRYVKNIDISKAIEKHYYTLIPLNRFPVFILYIDIDPSLVDINIHPKKNEVKLSNDNLLIEYLSEAIEDKLYPNRKIINPMPISNSVKEQTVNIFEIFEDNITQKSEKNNFIYDFNLEENNNKNEYVCEDTENYYFDNYIEENKPNSDVDVKEINSFLDEEKIDNKILEAKIIGTLFKTFIILEHSLLNKVYLIDQHAAHERVNYEKYKTQFENSEVISQLLLTPYIIDISLEEKEKLENNYDKFKALGFEIEYFGNLKLIIREVPILFGIASYENFIHDAISSLDKINKSIYEVDPYKIMKKACKASVKAGDHLSDLEIKELLKFLLNCENPYTCPHGRPTIIELNKKDIEKLFLRE